MKSVVSLRGRKAFEAVRAAGRVFRGEHLRFFYEFHRDRPGPVRVGVIVGKKHGSAVRRNLIKRRIRESCRLLMGLNPGETQNAFSVVVVYGGSKREAAARTSFGEIKGDVIEFVGVVRTLLASK